MIIEKIRERRKIRNGAHHETNSHLWNVPKNQGVIADDRFQGIIYDKKQKMKDK